jgi:4-hydroxy-tetrahydrodipicolinate synthase
MLSKFIGTGVALVTPFTTKGEVDYNSLEKLIPHTLDKVDYLVVNGTTAESATTTADEKKKILSTVLTLNQGKKPIMYGIGGNNTQELIETIQLFDFTGIDAVLSVSPYYNRPSQEGIYRHYTAIADVCPVPLFLYNVPGRTGSNILPSTTIRLSKHSNIVGIKDANTDVSHNLEILTGTSNDFLLISGDDMWAVPLIAIGGKGAISVLANAFPSEFSSMIKNALNRNFEESAHTLKSFNSINPLMYEEGNPTGIKVVLKHMDICGTDTRLPVAPASNALQEKITKALSVTSLASIA